MSRPQLKVGGIPVPWACLGEYTQRYEWIKGGGSLRAWRGSLVVQRRWKKIRTVISANGWAPPTLFGIEETAQVVISCPSPNKVMGATNTLSVPASRRSDTDILGYGVLPSGVLVPSSVVVVDDVVEVGVVSDAVGYTALYYPEIVASVSVSTDSQTTEASYGWELTAEEF